jgi:hypothetical protein
MTNAELPYFDDFSPKTWLLADGNPVTIEAPLVPTNLQWIILNMRYKGIDIRNIIEGNDILVCFIN